MDEHELRERLLAHLRVAPEVRRYPFGAVSTKPLDEALEVSIARHRTGEHRIYVVRRSDPPKLLLRLIWANGEPLTATHLDPGDWIDRLPPARAKDEPQEFNTRRQKPWSAR
jgi:hypothetical protein